MFIALFPIFLKSATSLPSVIGSSFCFVIVRRDQQRVLHDAGTMHNYFHQQESHNFKPASTCINHWSSLVTDHHHEDLSLIIYSFSCSLVVSVSVNTNPPNVHETRSRLSTCWKGSHQTCIRESYSVSNTQESTQDRVDCTFDFSVTTPTWIRAAKQMHFHRDCCHQARPNLATMREHANLASSNATNTQMDD